MGKMISDMDPAKFAPTALLKKEGASITGTLRAVREVETKFGPKPVYSMVVEDANCGFTVGGVDVEPESGATVEFFPPTRLLAQLRQVQMGQKVKIDYKGIAKGGRAHTFRVEVI